MATMKNTGGGAEVTKVLAVTFDKISKSKRARSGPNLRRSLLVQSVLYKAKDMYVTEVKNSKCAERLDSHMEESDDDSATMSTTTRLDNHARVSTTPTTNSSCSPAKVKRRFVSQTSVVEEERESQFEETPSDDDDEDTAGQLTHVLPFTRFSSTPSSLDQSESLVDNIIDELATESEDDASSTSVDKENSPPTAQSRTLTPPSCSRCLKRRSSTQDSDSDYQKPGDSFSNRNTTNYVPQKRLRSNSIDHSDSSSGNASSTTMTMMDTTASPINSLVKIFSQSFLELTSTDMDNTASHYEKSTELNTFALCRDSIALTA